MTYHFAQFNVAWLRKPLEHPDIADFRNAIDPVHELADQAPGFVWRMIADGHDDATTLRPLGEDGIINCTVWESRKAMAAWVYRNEHGDALKRRRDWFHRPMEPNVVMWWLPAGHTPTLDEALDRLQYLRTHGSTPLAFTFKDKYSPEDAEAYVNESGTPPLGVAHIGAEQARRCIDAYIDAWNEPQADQRRQILAQVMTDDGTYADPAKQMDSRAGIVEYIGKVLDKDPGRRIVRTSEVDVFHLVCRFTWRMVKTDGTQLPENVDVVEFARDGRIRRVTGFFGPLAPHEASSGRQPGTVDQRPSTDPALTTGLTAVVEQVLEPLDAFLRFEDGPDPARRRSEWHAALNEPLPHQGQGAQAVLDALNEVVIPHGLRIGAPGFSSHITTMPSIVPAVANFVGSLVAAQRWYASPGNFLEMLALNWMGQMLGMGAECGGTFTSGGAVANLVCLAAARQQAGERIGVNPTEQGAASIPEPRVYATASLHDVGVRALSVLGLGAVAMRTVPMDARRRADCDALTRMMDADIAAGCTPVAVIATAGDVRTGTIDPIDAMRTIAHDRGVWLHVDGAYGGFGVLDERVRPRYGDLSKIDSLAVDPHKWLAVPLGCGAAIVRDGALQQRSLVIGRPDFHHFDPISRGDLGSPFDEFGEGSLYSSVDFSARARGLTVWAALKEIGVEGMRARVGRHLDCARRVAELVRGDDRLELVAEPELSICCFRYIPPGASREVSPALDKLNEAVLKGVRARGRCVPSSAVVDDKFVIRPAFVGPNTEIADAEALVSEVLAVGDELSER